MASKWDREVARDICSWIQRATGASVPSDNPSDFAEELKNGQTLCQYVVMLFYALSCGDFVRENRENMHCIVCSFASSSSGWGGGGGVGGEGKGNCSWRKRNFRNIQLDGAVNDVRHFQC